MSSFKLHSDDSGFNNRVDNLFSCLETAAVDLEPQAKRTWDESNADEESDDQPCVIGHKFKRPAGFPPKGRGRARSYGARNSTPDYEKNPNNWVCYSMKDTEVSSDRENKQIGLKLFEELHAKKEEAVSAPTTEMEDISNSKIVFKKPTRTTTTDSLDSTMEEDMAEPDLDTKPDMTADALFGGTPKIRMKEYEVGQPKTKLKSKAKPKTNSVGKNKKDTVKLDYLEFEDEESD